ncbi:hypothetical protein JW905_00250, partial [bacterium]|nr:hypothetical protein [candidate division CSSED10-310 bacterium]
MSIPPAASIRKQRPESPLRWLVLRIDENLVEWGGALLRSLFRRRPAALLVTLGGLGFASLMLSRQWWLPPLGAAVLLLLAKKPWVGMSLFLLLLPVERYVNLPYFGRLTSHELLLLLTLVAWSLRRMV